VGVKEGIEVVGGIDGSRDAVGWCDGIAVGLLEEEGRLELDGVLEGRGEVVGPILGPWEGNVLGYADRDGLALGGWDGTVDGIALGAGEMDGRTLTVGWGDVVGGLLGLGDMVGYMVGMLEGSSDGAGDTVGLGVPVGAAVIVGMCELVGRHVGAIEAFVAIVVFVGSSNSCCCLCCCDCSRRCAFCSCIPLLSPMGVSASTTTSTTVKMKQLKGHPNRRSSEDFLLLFFLFNEAETFSLAILDHGREVVLCSAVDIALMWTYRCRWCCCGWRCWCC
jgi:hypothetical protein